MAYLCTSTDVLNRLSERGYQLRLDDRPEAITSVLREATNRVKAYCLPLYDADDLQADADAGGFVNDLATSLAVCALCRRRGNTIPASFKDLCKQTNDDLEMVRRQQLQLPGVEQRHIASPAFSNVRVLPGYIFKKVRVESSISEGTTPRGYVQNIDWLSTYTIEY